MALVLILKSVEDLRGKADRIARVTFRGLPYDSKKVKGAKNAVYFGESFDWPIARNIEPEETLLIEIFNHNTYLSNKLVGSYTLVLQQIIQDGELSICENLVDANNRLIETKATFEVKYYSPDGKVGRWEEVEFQYPLIQQWNRPGDELDNATTGAGSMDNLSERFNLIQDQDGSSQADTSSLLSFGSGIMTGEDTAAQQAALEAVYMAKQTRHDMLEAELHKPRDFQVNITILEAQQLSGLNIDPVIKVEVGGEKKYTAIKQSTNCPYYNEYFVFDYRQSPIHLFDKMITITAYDATRLPGRNVLKAGNILAGSVIGSFKCDVGTVYAASDHQFFHRWAVLLHPKDIMEGPKGYVKCDISVIGRGDVVRAQKPDKDEDNIEGNLLLPAGVPMERQSASYRVVIYRAEDLPRMDSGIMASVKKALTLSKQAFIDAYVKVSFVGHVGKTSVKKSYNPEFKEQLSFIDMFPPLCNRIKVELCDSDAISDEPIATHFIELPQIMDPGGEAEGILPTFGPSWINFYGAPRNYKMLEYYSDLNEGLGEGCAYRGRLLISVKTELLDADMASASTVYKDKVRSANKVEVAPKKEFLLFSTLLDASMIDKEYKDKEVYFEVSIGTYGNKLDAKGETSLVSESEGSDEDDDDDDGGSSNLLKKEKEIEENLPCNSCSEPMRGQSDDKCYYYLPICEEKPCLYVVGRFEDLRKRLYHSNILDKIAEQLDEALEDLRVTIRSERPNQRYKLKCAMDELIKGCDTYMRMVSSLSVGAGSGKTKLDKHRLKSCEAQINALKKTAKMLKSGITRDNVRDRYKEAKDYLKKVKHLAKEPQHSIPDVFIWMVADKKRVAYHRIAAKDLLAATFPEQQGKDCGKVQTFFLKKPGKDGQGTGGWAIQAKVLMYLWLGQRDPKKPNRDYIKGVPEAYLETAEVKQAHITPPRSLVFQGEVHFQLRAYLYQARSLIGSDDSGLSDPFARVIFWNQCQQSRIIEATLSPTWDQVLVFDKIIIHGDPKVIAASSLTVIVEFFDYDAVGDPEFLGRCMARPRVKMAAEPYAAPDFPAPLQWWDVFRGSAKAGELLASFELLEGDASAFPALPAQIITHEKKPGYTPIPQQIKPSVSKHRLEIMFWGVREPKRVQLLSVDRPRAEVEVAGVVTAAKPIANMQKNSNFEKTLDFVDLYLPDNELFWPPLTIRVMDCRNFGREVLVGTATVSSLNRYIYVSREERLRRQEEQRQREARLAALKEAASGEKPASTKDAASVRGTLNGSVLGNGSVVGSFRDGRASALSPSGRGTPRGTASRAASVIVEQPPSLGDPYSPSVVVMQPSRAGSRAQSLAPSRAGSRAQSLAPQQSLAHSRSPSMAHSMAPSMAPSHAHSLAPSHAHSMAPSHAHSQMVPYRSPSRAQSLAPSMQFHSRAQSEFGTPLAASSRTTSAVGVPPPSRTPSRQGSVVGSRSLSRRSVPTSLQNGTQPQDTVIEIDPNSCIVPVGPDQVALTSDDQPLVSGTDPAGGPPTITIIGPDGQPLPEGVLGVGPDGQPLPPGVSPLGPDGKPLPPGVIACGPDGKPLPPGVLGVGADGLPLPPGVPPVDADGKPLPTGSAVPGGAGGPGGPGAPGAQEAKKPPIKNYKELIADLDWWSKYHVTMEDMEKEEAAKELDTEDDLDDEETLYDEEEVFKGQFRPMDYTGFDMDDITRLKELAEAAEEDEDDPLNAKLRKKKKKKKKKNKKKQMKKRLKKLKGKFNQAFSKEDEEEEDEYEQEVEEDKSHISRIKVYDHELEEVPDFEGFEDWVETFYLYRGKKVDDDEDDMARVSGKFKGSLCLYKLKEGDDGQEDVTHTHSTLMPKLKLMEHLPSHKPHEVLVRIYVIQALDLHPVDLNGKADPYMVIKCGRRERNDKDNKQNNTLNPVFGKMYEMDVVFPMDSMLNIKVMDYDTLSSDDLIGETNIDLENRFYSKYRPSCGVANDYELFGYNTWRDPMRPTQIVARLCKDHHIDPPVYGRDGDVTFMGQRFHADKQIENEQGERVLTDELMAMKVIKNWPNVPLGFPLVPEHVETRRLYNPEKPGVEQGRLQMWVDMFPKDQPAPTHTVDITARKPQEYVLRCVIWNTDDVVLEDTNPLTGEASSDIFVRGYMLGMGEDDQSTDVHYRSLDGEGNFNWRFAFPFDYLKAEEKIVYKKKESIFSMEETELKVPCKLTLQVWDADLVSADDFLGSVTLDLNRMVKPTKDSKNCTLKILGPEAPRFNLFKQKRCRGWFPMFADSVPEASEDSDEDEDEEKKGPRLIGKVEAEIHLMTKEEADKCPAGLGREAPEQLPEPNRPDSSFLWFCGPFKALKHVIWKKWKWAILKALFICLLIALLGLFLYSIPGATVGKIFS